MNNGKQLCDLGQVTYPPLCLGFSHLQNGDDNSTYYFIELWLGLGKVIHLEYLEQGFRHSKRYVSATTCFWWCSTR